MSGEGLIAEPRAVHASVGRARLQELTEQGWATIAHLHPSPTGHFVVSLRATHSTELRLAYNGLAGTAETLRVSRRLAAGK